MLLALAVCVSSLFGSPSAASADDSFHFFRFNPTLAYARLLRAINPRLPLAKARDYAEQVLIDAERTGLDPRLLVALVTVESHWKAQAVSRRGARGLGQLMPATAADLGVDAFSPHQNLRGTSVYLRSLIDRFRNHPEQYRLAIGAYNAGPNAVSRYGGIPPYAETQTYVKRVLRLWHQVSLRIDRSTLHGGESAIRAAERRPHRLPPWGTLRSAAGPIGRPDLTLPIVAVPSPDDFPPSSAAATVAGTAQPS